MVGRLRPQSAANLRASKTEHLRPKSGKSFRKDLTRTLDLSTAPGKTPFMQGSVPATEHAFPGAVRAWR